MSTQKEETRLRLFEAARKLFESRGFHGVKLEDIAEAAGVSRQAVYKSHFSSKADLVLELARHLHVAEKLDELIQPARDAKTGVATLEATIAAIIGIELRLHDLGVVLSAAARSDAGAAVAWRERMEGKRAGIRMAFTRLAADGQLDPAWKVEEAVDVLAALLSNESYHSLVVEQGWQPGDVKRKIWQICRQTFVVEPATRSKRRR